MTNFTEIMMSDTSNQLTVTGDKIRADGWFGSKDGNHTISISVTNFTGRVGIEGTLASKPTEEDWFPINLNGQQVFLVYPRTPGGNTQEGTETSTTAFNILGNFIWLRALMDRENLGFIPTDPDDISRLGNVTEILLSR